MAATSDVLLLELHDRVALVTLHRPAVRNALNTALIDALWEVLPAVDRDPAVRPSS
jgi:enoyl-CoA hydratase